MEQATQMNQDAARFNQSGQAAQTYSGNGSGRPQGNGSGGYEVPSEGGQGREVSATGAGAGQAAQTTIMPPVDIFEDESGFTLVADLPGVSKEQLGVRVTGDNLVIEGTAAAHVNGEMELLYGEVNNPQYRRSFTLSRELDPGKIEARLNNGVLTLTIPKAEEAKPRRINVTVG
ncbi:MAG: heat shock protein Hsp20 [Polaromonas sp.]|nr:heat shock protein Hsp20 [Polaromonas sp.]